MAEVKPYYMHDKYSALRFIIYTNYIAAALIVLYSTYIVIGTLDANPSSGGILFALGGVVWLFFVFAFGLVVTAQIISVFIDMEWNQRETIELLQQIIKNQQ